MTKAMIQPTMKIPTCMEVIIFKRINLKLNCLIFKIYFYSFSKKDDLISLLDINSQHAESVLLEAEGSVFDEESFRLTRRFGGGGGGSGGGGRLNPNSLSGSANANSSGSHSAGATSDLNADRGDSRKSAYRIRDHRWYDSYRDEIFSNSSSSSHHNHHHHHHRTTSSNTANNVNTNSSSHQNSESRGGDTNTSNTNAEHSSQSKPIKSLNTFSFGDKLQFWPDKFASGEKAVFKKIASIYSELIAVSKHDGQLHQWKWSSEMPYSSKINLNSLEALATSANNECSLSLTIFHPKVLFLQLLNERICDVSAATARASCWTESGKVKDFCSSLSYKNNKLVLKI